MSEIDGHAPEKDCDNKAKAMKEDWNKAEKGKLTVWGEMKSAE